MLRDTRRGLAGISIDGLLSAQDHIVSTQFLDGLR